MVLLATKHIEAIFVAFFFLSLITPPVVPQPLTSTAPDMTMSLIFEVIPLDVSQYNMELVLHEKASSDSGSLSDLPNISTEESVTYNLTNNNGEITTVSCTFQNNRLFTLFVTAPSNTELLYSKPSDDVLELAKGVLNRYQNFLGDDSLLDVVNTLNAVEKVTNNTITINNVKLEMKQDSYGTRFYWSHVYNGVEYNEISIAFQQNRRIMMGDKQSRYKMGITKIKIAEKEALETALNYVENYSYEAIGGTDENETIITVSNFNISREFTTTELSSGERDGLLYPYWRVKVALGDLYPGNVYGFSVKIWADSGEIAGLGTLAVGADSNSFPVDDSTITPSVQENEAIPALNIDVAIIVIALVALTVPIITLVLKKRRNK